MMYVVKERDLEWLIDKGLPIKVLSDEEARESVFEFIRKKGLSHNGSW